MSRDWKPSAPSGGGNEDLRSYLEERKRRASEYVRTAKAAQKRIDRLRTLEEQHARVLGNKSKTGETNSS